MRAFVLDDGRGAELPFGEGAERFGRAILVWLHIDAREAAGRTWLDQQTDIPFIARTALTASETRPRSDLVGHGVVVNLRGIGATPDDDPDPLVSVRFWAETGRVVTFTYRKPQAIGILVRRFLEGRISDPGDLLSTYADTVTAELDPVVARLGDEVDACESSLDGLGLRERRRKVSRARSAAIAYRRFVSPQRQALERLALVPIDWLDENDRAHLRESADRAARMVEELESVRERSALIHEELTDLRAEQMDTRALLISIVALVFLPLTFITGLLGMNVEGIPFASRPWAFWGVTAFCVAVAIGVTAWFIRHRWIGRL
jgi:zinc transporter